MGHPQLLKLVPGTVIQARYEVVKLLGHGAVGTAVLVSDRELDGQELVLKVLHAHLAANATTLKRFNAEALLGRQISHPNVARIYDVASDGGIHFLTMEYIDGCTLRDLLQGSATRRLPLDEAMHILLQILNGLIAAHGMEIIHRDLKPENVLVDRTGAVKLIDFGIAKAVETAAGLTRTGEAIGTPDYMAPEQFMNRADPRSDLYSWSIIAYEMLIGRLPFIASSSLELMNQHRLQPFPEDSLRAEGVPEAIVAVLSRCAAKELDNRPHSTRACLTEILGIYSPTKAENTRREIVQVVRRNQRSHHLLNLNTRRWVRFIWAAVVLIAVFGVFYERICRERLLKKAVPIMHAVGVSPAPLLWMFGFGEYSSFDHQALLRAIENADSYAIRLLIHAGVSAEVIDPQGLSTYHQLLAKPSYFLNDFCRIGANIEARSPTGDTPLLAAVRMGSSWHVSGLLDCGASMQVRDKFGNTPLVVALTQSDQILVELLLRLSPGGVLRTQHVQNANGQTALFVAVDRELTRSVERMLAAGFDPNIRDAEGATVMMRLVEQPMTDPRLDVVEELRKHGANVRAADNQGKTLTHYLETSSYPEWRQSRQLTDLWNEPNSNH